MSLIRSCPTCKNPIVYLSEPGLLAAEEIGSLCAHCAAQPGAVKPKLSISCCKCGKVRTFRDKKGIRDYIETHLLPETRLCMSCYRDAKCGKKMTDMSLDECSSVERALRMEWADKVKSRDHHTCIACSSAEEPNAHHILPVRSHPFLSLQVRNGITLCASCHQGPGSVHGNGEPLNPVIADLRLKLLE